MPFLSKYLLLNYMVSDKELKSALLHKLVRRGKWGHSHTSFDNLSKGFLPHLKGRLKELAEALLREGLLLSKPTSYGLEVSLNPAEGQEIKERIKRFFSETF